MVCKLKTKTESRHEKVLRFSCRSRGKALVLTAGDVPKAPRLSKKLGESPTCGSFCFCVQEILGREWGVAVTLVKALGIVSKHCLCCSSLGKLRPEGKKCFLSCSFLASHPS